MVRIYGSPNIKSAKTIQSRDDFMSALRAGEIDGDEKAVTNGISGSSAAVGVLDLGGGFRTNHFDGYRSYLEAATKKVWALARIIDLKANVVLSTETKLIYRDEAKNKPDAVVKADPDLVKLLLKPNPFDTWSEMLYLWVGHMVTCGNVFWLKDEINLLGQPKNLYCLNPMRMTIVGSKSTRVSHYIYHVNGTEIRFEVDEIIHWKRPNVADPLWGLGEVQQAEGLFNDFINRQLHGVRMMANGGAPTSILVKEGDIDDDAQWKKNIAYLNEKYFGQKNVGKVGFMNGKWSILQLGMDATKLQDAEKYTKNVEDIFINSGVPLSVAGFQKAANYATARVDDIAFRKNAILPLLNMLADQLNDPTNGLIALFNPDLKWDFSLQGLVDIEQVMKEMEPMFRCGAVTPNDINEACGRPRVNNPMLDQYFVPNNMIPIDLAGIADEGSLVVEEETKPKPGKKPKPKPSRDEGEERQAA